MGNYRFKTLDSAENAMNRQRKGTKSAKEKDSALLVPLRCHWDHFIFRLPDLISRRSSMFFDSGSGVLRFCIGMALVATAAVWGDRLVAQDSTTDRPNVLWLTCEDISPNLGCYGDQYAITPNLDRLAQQSVRYTQAVGITGVCAVNRSCLITGMYSSTIGSQDMRSGIRLPESIRVYSDYLRQAGYYCTNNSKTDYNFAVPKNAWDACSSKAHWKNRRQGQPFFAVFNYTGTHESQYRLSPERWKKRIARLTPDQLHDPARAPIPPFHPDTPEVRRDWANYYDTITALDYWIADQLKELEQAELADNTIVFFYSDHGVGLPSCKKWVWDWGLRVPLIVYFPPKYRHLAPCDPGGVCHRLVSFVDFAPTLLSLTAVSIPEHMQGVAFLGERAGAERRYVFAIRDRMAERYDVVRVVRDRKYQYHRNFMPHLPWSQYVSYTEEMPTMQVWRQLHEQERLDAAQERYFQPKPTEELYDIENDPHMLKNLASDPKHAAIVGRMQTALHNWQLRTRDLGLLTEYEMHRRAEGSSQYEVGQSERSYPLKKILAVAEVASQQDAKHVEQLARWLSDDEPTVRWWAATGLAVLKQKARPAESALEVALRDTSPVVRIAAAEVLCNLGQVEAMLPVLTEGLAHATPYVRLRAMNALDRLGKKTRPALPAIRAAAMKKAPYPGDYFNRMVGYVPERLGQ